MSEFSWASKAAERLGLDPETATIGDLVMHAGKYQAITGKVGYWVEDLNRCEGKVPDVVKGEIEGDVDVVHHISEVLMTDPAANKAARALEKRFGVAEN